MGIIELIIVVLLVLWLLGYFGRGRFVTGLAGGNLVHTLLVIVVILVILRLLNII